MISFFNNPKGSYFANPEMSNSEGSCFWQSRRVPNRRVPVFANPDRSYFTNQEESQFGAVLFLPIRRGPHSEGSCFCLSGGVSERRSGGVGEIIFFLRTQS